MSLKKAFNCLASEKLTEINFTTNTKSTARQIFYCTYEFDLRASALFKFSFLLDSFW
jgi:hypothetical protein